MIRVFVHDVRVALRCVAMRGRDRQEVALKRAERLVINVGQFRVAIFLTRFVRPLRIPYALPYTRARALTRHRHVLPRIKRFTCQFAIAEWLYY